MPLAEALPRLEALAEAAEEVEETAAADERQCDLCWDAPRSVRWGRQQVPDLPPAGAAAQRRDWAGMKQTPALIKRGRIITHV